jgi:hypothetical protein
MQEVVRILMTVEHDHFGRIEGGRFRQLGSDVLSESLETAHLVQMFDSTVVRAHVSAAGAKWGSMIRHLAARVAASLPRFTSRPTSSARVARARNIMNE